MAVVLKRLNRLFNRALGGRAIVGSPRSGSPPRQRAGAGHFPAAAPRGFLRLRASPSRRYLPDHRGRRLVARRRPEHHEAPVRRVGHPGVLDRQPGGRVPGGLPRPSARRDLSGRAGVEAGREHGHRSPCPDWSSPSTKCSDASAPRMDSSVIRTLLAARYVAFSAVVVLLVALAIWGRRVGYEQSINSFFAEDDPYMRVYQQAAQTFGDDNFVFVVYDDPELLTPAGHRSGRGAGRGRRPGADRGRAAGRVARCDAAVLGGQRRPARAGSLAGDGPQPGPERGEAGRSRTST